MKKLIIKLLFIISAFLVFNSIFLIRDCQSQWVQCDGIYGGKINTLTVNGNKVF